MSGVNSGCWVVTTGGDRCLRNGDGKMIYFGARRPVFISGKNAEQLGRKFTPGGVFDSPDLQIIDDAEAQARIAAFEAAGESQWNAKQIQLRAELPLWKDTIEQALAEPGNSPEEEKSLQSAYNIVSQVLEHGDLTAMGHATAFSIRNRAKQIKPKSEDERSISTLHRLARRRKMLMGTRRQLQESAARCSQSLADASVRDSIEKILGDVQLEVQCVDPRDLRVKRRQIALTLEKSAPHLERLNEAIAKVSEEIEAVDLAVTMQPETRFDRALMNALGVQHLDRGRRVLNVDAQMNAYCFDGSSVNLVEAAKGNRNFKSAQQRETEEKERQARQAWHTAIGGVGVVQ